MAFDPNVEQNVRFLGDRAREIVDQEVERARALDTKAAGLIAATLAGLAGGLTFVTKLPDLQGGSGAKTLWAFLLVLGLALLLPAGAFAVRAILPQAFRIAVHVDELSSWLTRRVLERDPTDVEGELLYGSVIAVKDARAINEAKAARITRAFYAFAAALLCVVACGASVAVHAAVYSEKNVVHLARPAA